MNHRDDDKAFDDDPFERIPSDLSYTGTKKAESRGSMEPSTGTSEVSDEEFKYIHTERVGKSTLALISGMGFVLIAILLYFFLSRYGDMDTYIITFLALLFATLISFFYLLDDLTIRPHFITNRGAHFISGMFLGALVLLIIMVLNTNWDILFIIPFFVVTILMSVSVALFLYALLWEE